MSSVWIAERLNDIALYLDFVMLGSANAGFFTDDGDQSGPPGAGISAADVPEGSAGIERTLGSYLYLAGKRPADMPLSTRTDYHPFMVAGVPIGGMTGGASQTENHRAGATLGWAGRCLVRPELPECSRHGRQHQPGSAGSHGCWRCLRGGLYAESIGGVNGVPPHDKRHRTPVP